MEKHSAATNVTDAAGVAGVVATFASYLTQATTALTFLIGVATLVWAVFRAWNEVGTWRKRRRDARKDG